MKTSDVTSVDIKREKNVRVLLQKKNQKKTPIYKRACLHTQFNHDLRAQFDLQVTYKQRNNPRKLDVIKDEESLSPSCNKVKKKKKHHSCLVPKMWLCILVAVAPK